MFFKFKNEGNKQISLFWKIKCFLPYEEEIQIDTIFDQSENKVSIDQSKASLLIHSLLVYF